MPTGKRPVIRSFPRADRAFQDEVERLVESELDVSDPDAPSALERLLRAHFPAARVSPQDPLASFGGASAVWYVYRRDAPSEPATDEGGPAARATHPPEGAAGDPVPDARATAAATGESFGPGHGARPVYSAAATASMIGVPVTILVGWDEEQHFVEPRPTPSGHRLYSRDDLEDLLVVKRLTTAGRGPADIRAELVAARDRRRSGPFGAVTVGGRRMLILLAERDPYAAEMAEYFLRTEGYDVDVAFSSREAEDRATERRPDLSVVELLISGGAGAELCARLKSQTGAAVLAISTLDHEEAALRSGADAFLTKPLDPLELVSTIKDLLGESAMLRPRAAS
jgi:CheY-like chemotaxis protein